MSLALLARRSIARCRPRCLRGYHQSARSTGHQPDAFSYAARVGLVSGTLFGAALAYGPTYADAPDSDERTRAQRKRAQPSLASLLRSYVVFSACSVPFVVDNAPTVLSVMMSIPGIKQVTEAVVRATFFKHFVGGDTAEDCLPLLEQYRAENKGCLFAYSVEVDENEAAGKDAGGAAKDVQPVHKRIVQEMIHSIDVAADFEERHVVNPADPAKGRKTWVAIKLTALLPHAQSLIKFSSHLIKTRPPTPDIPFPGIPHASDLSVLYDSTPPPSSPLTEADIVELRELHQDLVRICTRAKEMGVRIILDAEYSWYQPAIDAYVYALVRQFNSRSDFPASDATPNVQPLVYQTYQAYLRRTPGYLNQSIRDAYLHNYALGVKLVRGAYHPHETLAHPSSAQTSAALRSLSISPDPLLPVWAEKAETDRCYNECARVLVENIRHDVETRRGGASFWSWGRRQGQERDVPRIGVLFGTHNWESANKILEELAKNGLAEREREDGEDVFRVPEAVTERLTMGQLYGMCDALTDYLVDKTRCSAPFVIKYVPYGALSEVMPYLSRRAIENKSVLGNGAAAMERKRAWNEIRKRLFG